jgi:hypothetical protein
VRHGVVDRSFEAEAADFSNTISVVDPVNISWLRCLTISAR